MKPNIKWGTRVEAIDHTWKGTLIESFREGDKAFGYIRLDTGAFIDIDSNLYEEEK
jgi:hypothetical protein